MWRAGGRAKDKVAPDINALFGVRSYVLGRSKPKGPAGGSCSGVLDLISLCSHAVSHG